MREIKFRCYDKNEGYMLPWEHLVQAGDLPEMLLHGHEEDADYSRLMQYTGLKDKNGIEIYEGDLIRCNTMSNHKVFEVIYGRCSFEFIRETGSRYRADQLLWSDINVVSNIYKTGNSRKLEILYQDRHHDESKSDLPF